MKIFADLSTSEFKVLGLESGFFFGHYDVLKGTKSEVYHHSFTIFKGENINSSITAKPKIYIHIPKNIWSFFTGKLREYCLS